uniref:Hexosyltransferase n=1 Tax=Heterorhabditis bacteriophora TaxID=37862 RepID=A0A1I7WPQ9_HETBA
MLTHKIVNIIRQNILWLFLILFICLSGFLDHLFETSFDHFQWPLYNVDVLAETRRYLAKEPVNSVLINDWQLLHRLVEPHWTCIKNKNSNTLLIIVKSAVQHIRRREAIRNTWGQLVNMDGFEIRTIFVVGRFTDKRVEIEVRKEAEVHNDILIADMLDTYRNNTIKFLFSIGYAFRPVKNCPPADFVFLIDDDYMVSIYNIIRLLEDRNPLEQMYEGWMFDSTPFRFRLHKHSVSIYFYSGIYLDVYLLIWFQVSLADYPFDKYPPYISAGAVLFSQVTIAHFYYAVQFVQLCYIYIYNIT